MIKCTANTRRSSRPVWTLVALGILVAGCQSIGPITQTPIDPTTQVVASVVESETPVPNSILSESERTAAALQLYPKLIQEATSSHNQGMQWLLSDTTALESAYRYGPKPSDLIDVSDATWKDFVEQNADPRPLIPLLENGYDYLAQADINGIWANEAGWEQFRRVHGQLSGFIIVSSIGYSPDMGQALAVASMSCGTTCGEGNLYIFKREAEDWVVMQTEMLWVS